MGDIEKAEFDTGRPIPKPKGGAYGFLYGYGATHFESGAHDVAVTVFIGYGPAGIALTGGPGVGATGQNWGASQGWMQKMKCAKSAGVYTPSRDGPMRKDGRTPFGEDEGETWTVQ